MQNLSHEKILKDLRSTILEMVYHAGEGHIPSAFSILEILYVLYRDCLTIDPEDAKNVDRDYFILSKGHAGAALYAVLSQFGFIDRESLFSYCKPKSPYGGHPDLNKVNGVEVCSGSLGHGVAMAAGIAMANKHYGRRGKVVTLVGDGEMDEGSFWETVMLARNLDLSNFIVIADCNESQLKYSKDFEFNTILKSFGWNSLVVDGHCLASLSDILVPLLKVNQTAPTFVVAKTIKGSGIERFIAKGTDNAWHRRTPTQIELSEILGELK